MICGRRRPNSPPVLFAGLGLALSILFPGLAAAQPVASSDLAAPLEISAHVRNGQRFMGIRLLGALRLQPVKVDGQLLRELSGLAYDQDEDLLYAVSDGGRLFHLRPRFSGDVLTGVEALAGFALKDADGRPLKGRWADSEGLDLENGDNGVAGDGRLLVSFERRPRLVHYAPDGRLLESVPMPAELATAANYDAPNRALESAAVHPEFGWLTAPELPMRGRPAGIIDIWSGTGSRWEYPLRQVPNNALVAIEVLEDGSLVTLERGHGRLYAPLIISLRRTSPLSNGPPRLADVSTAAVFNSSKSWRIDNFEGLTRHRGRRFFLVSDDNENSVQATILLYLEIVDSKPTDYRPVESDTRQENQH